MQEDRVVVVDNVSFGYDGQLALDSINLTVKRGEFLGIIGPNGSGKTTLLKIMLGLLTPRKGDVFLFGTPLKDFKHWSKIGYVPQKAGLSALHFPITVNEVVGLGGASDEAIADALRSVDIFSLRQKPLNELSGGQQQRVFIARALVSDPELLMLDEPTVAVDVDAQEKFYAMLHGLHKKKKLTLVLISHDVDVVAREVSSIACINRRLLCRGASDDIVKSTVMEKLYGKDVRFVVHTHV